MVSCCVDPLPHSHSLRFPCEASCFALLIMVTNSLHCSLSAIAIVALKTFGIRCWRSIVAKEWSFMTRMWKTGLHWHLFKNPKLENIIQELTQNTLETFLYLALIKFDSVLQDKHNICCFCIYNSYCFLENFFFWPTIDRWWVEI